MDRRGCASIRFDDHRQTISQLELLDFGRGLRLNGTADQQVAERVNEGSKAMHK